MSGGHEVLEHLLVDLVWKAGIVTALVVAVGLACWRIAVRDRATRAREVGPRPERTARPSSRHQG